MPKDSREAFFCVRCRYKFKAKDGITKALKCPFCGKTDKIIQDKKETSDNLINDTAIKFVQNQEPEEKPGFKLLKIKRKN